MENEQRINKSQTGDNLSQEKRVLRLIELLKNTRKLDEFGFSDTVYEPENLKLKTNLEEVTR